MKKIITILILGILFISCDKRQIEPLIITRVSTSIQTEFKYYYFINDNSDIYYYTNNKYTVGDTIKIR